MSSCNIDHTHEDVQKKYESQREFLPAEIQVLFGSFFSRTQSQELLNEVFHLLKKYDLSTEDERQRRDEQLQLVLK